MLWIDASKVDLLLDSFNQSGQFTIDTNNDSSVIRSKDARIFIYIYYDVNVPGNNVPRNKGRCAIFYYLDTFRCKKFQEFFENLPNEYRDVFIFNLDIVT
jgi:hypothetical protein